MMCPFHEVLQSTKKQPKTVSPTLRLTQAKVTSFGAISLGVSRLKGHLGLGHQKRSLSGCMARACREANRNHAEHECSTWNYRECPLAYHVMLVDLKNYQAGRHHSRLEI